MGDRANVYMKHADKGVYFYTHWAGSELPETVRTALDSRAGHGRWTDPAYLGRIIFCEMVSQSDDIKGETGYGISPEMCDNDGYPIIVVDSDTQTISFQTEADGTWRTVSNGGPYTFEEYTALAPATWPAEKDVEL